MSTVKELLKRVTAMLIVAFMLFAELSIVGNAAISYAIDAVATNNENVEILAYFENQEGEKVTEIDSKINEKLKLKMDVTVKNEQGYGGYFDGSIELQDANFKMEDESEISLHINAGETETIEKEIKYAEIEEMYGDYLSKESSIVLKGKYINSRKEYDIEGTTKVKARWVSEETVEAEMKMEVLTNSTYNIEEKNKKVVQLLIRSKEKNNSYPVRNTKIVLDKPEGATKVEVHKRSTEATNGDAEFGESNYRVDEENKKVEINISNEAGNAWGKETEDVIVVTYEFGEETETEGIKINGEDTITLFDGKEINTNGELTIEGTVDGKTTGTIVEIEKEIYKGKIYTGEERNYISVTQINADYIEAIEKIEVEEKSPVFVSEEGEKETNTRYIRSDLKKEEFLKIFGEEGYIRIEDQEGNVVSNINKDTETNENGNIEITYGEDVTGIKIETSKPVTTGVLNIAHEKAIKNKGYSREEIEKITGIKEKVEVNGITDEKTINLKETKTEATLKLENSTLSEDQKELRIVAKLQANDESQDLYKDPKIKFTLPKEIEGLKVEQSKALYINGLKLDKSNVSKNEKGEYEIEIDFKGEQKKYDSNGGMEVYIYLDTDLKEIKETKASNITMEYTNANKSVLNFVKTELTLEQTILSANGGESQTTTDLGEGLTVTTEAISGKESLTENQEIYQGETIRYEMTIANYTEQDLENINVKATQTNGKVWGLKTILVNNEATGDVNKEEHVYQLLDSNEVTFDKIEKLEKGESITLQYETTVNKDATGETYGTIQITTEDGSINKQVETIKNTIKEAELQVIFNEVHSREIKWYSEKNIRPSIKLQNLTDRELQNVIVQVILPPDVSTDGTSEYFLFDENIEGEFLSTEKNDGGETIVTIKVKKIAANGEGYILVFAKNREMVGYEQEIDISLLAKATVGENIYTSNELVRTVYRYDNNLEVTLTGTTESGASLDKDTVVKNGELLKFTAKIKNNEDKNLRLEITEVLPSGFEIKSATMKTKEETKNVMSNVNSGALELRCDIGANEEIVLDFTATIDTSKRATNNVKVDIHVFDSITFKSYSPKIEFTIDKKQDVSLEEIYDIISAGENEEDNKQDDNKQDDNKQDDNKQDDNKQDDNKQDDNKQDDKSKEETQKVQYKVSGTIWLDRNKDGVRVSTEDKMKDIQVRAVNTETGKLVDTVATSGNDGTYSLKLDKGKYVLVYFYDSDNYNITTYQAKKVSSTVNSDVVTRQMKYDNKVITVGATDVLNVKSNLENIDMGLVYKKKFDLKLEKTVNKITVSNTQGTKEYKQKDGANLAKVEIKSRYMDGTNVTVEYKLKVKNVGELAGYASEITDYLSSEFNYDTKLNSGWTKEGNNLINKTLEKKLIKPGETKEVTLILTKKMTSSNTGLVNNTAKITKSINTQGIEDLTEDNASADVIIGISTGAIVTYTLIILSIIAVIGGTIYVINNKKRKVEM